MLTLRLTREGVSEKDFRERFAKSPQEVFGTELDDLIHLDLLEKEQNIIRLTKKGRLLGNQVFIRFVG